MYESESRIYRDTKELKFNKIIPKFSKGIGIKFFSLYLFKI